MIAFLLGIAKVAPIFLPFVQSLAQGRVDKASDAQKSFREIQLANVNLEVATRANMRDIRLATSGFWEMRLATFLIAIPFIDHLWAVWLDTRFDWYADNCWIQNGVEVCGVKAFPSPFDEWQGAILLSFFGISFGGKAVASIAHAFGRKRR